MQTIFYILASLATVVITTTAVVLGVRLHRLLGRVEETRRDLTAMIADGATSLQQANHVLAGAHDGVERLRQAMARFDRVLALLQPSTAVGGILAGARRVFAGRQTQVEP